MLFSLLKHYLELYITHTALKVSRSLYYFTTSIFHGVENYFPRLYFVFTEVRLITATAAAGLWSPLNNFLAFHIFLSLLPFFKTIGAGKILGILCADLKLYLR